MAKRYILYLLRWQLSTPILAFSLIFFNFGVTWNTVIANLIGGLIFFWVDRFIFTIRANAITWEVTENIDCSVCGKNTPRGYRMMVAGNRAMTTSGFCCENCSHISAHRAQLSGAEPYVVA